MTVRRKFLVALVGSALAAPLAPLAQPPARARRIGFLWEADTIPRALDAFSAALRELGYVQGRDYVIEQRSAKGDLRLLKPLAAELVALNVDLIVATTGIATIAASGVTRDVPIVTTGSGDPVGEGWAASLGKPGGNVTGLSNQSAEVVIKQLDLLRQIIPNLRRVGFLYHPANTGTAVGFARLESECRKLQIRCFGA